MDVQRVRESPRTGTTTIVKGDVEERSIRARSMTSREQSVEDEEEARPNDTGRGMRVW